MVGCMTSRIFSLVLLAGAAPLLGACDTISRFGGGGQPAPVAIGQPMPPVDAADDTLAAPVDPASRRPLPGPTNPGMEPSVDTGEQLGSDEPLTAPGAAAPGDDLAPGTPAISPGGPQVAGLPDDGVPPVEPPGTTVATPRPPAPAAPTTTSRVVGSWKVSEQNGTSCRLALSSAPFVDLSRASTSGCSPALARVNAWKLDNGEIVLFETGGAVAARLRGGGGSFNGAAVKTGAPVSISR